LIAATASGKLTANYLVQHIRRKIEVIRPEDAIAAGVYLNSFEERRVAKRTRKRGIREQWPKVNFATRIIIKANA
jgi:hypothetical protein